MKKPVVLGLVLLLVVAGAGYTFDFGLFSSLTGYQTSFPTFGSYSQTGSTSCMPTPTCCPPCPPPPPTPDYEVDVKPGSYPNAINLNPKSNGVVAVALLDGADQDPSTATFAGADPVRYTTEDVNNDGTPDLLFHFKKKDLNLDQFSTVAGLTVDDNTYWDTVKIVPKNNK